MYIYKEYNYTSVIIHEYHYKGNQGAKGETRTPKKNITPEQIQLHNQRQKEKRVQLLLLENFKKGDYYITLTYKAGKGQDLTFSEAKAGIKTYLDKMRYEYKKRNDVLKFIYSIERGENRGLHIHLVVNRIPDTDEISEIAWEKVKYHGHVAYRKIDDSDPSMSKLAEYLTKPPSKKAIANLKAWSGSDDISKISSYSCSRNLKRPVPKEKTYGTRTMAKIINNDIKPTDGFYIDQDIQPPIKGINPYNGWNYLSYQEIRLTAGTKAPPVRFCECPNCHQFTINGFICDCYTKKRKRTRS